ncbi:unnamed protein product [Euphydryas editha]|uniref:Uncharacterized protein n=1 Tax=Euphydryas editha TaxID=104508 RepID=A0AAU9USU7_EUPED|nr:unnamed protein product [Euphydryas editha]
MKIPRSPIAQELNRYCKREFVAARDIKQDIHSWQIKHVFLCAPAGTVYSKCLFSEIGNVYEVEKNEIRKEITHHNIQCIQNNLIDHHHNIFSFERDSIVNIKNMEFFRNRRYM